MNNKASSTGTPKIINKLTFSDILVVAKRKKFNLISWQSLERHISSLRIPKIFFNKKLPTGTLILYPQKDKGFDYKIETDDLEIEIPLNFQKKKNIALILNHHFTRLATPSYFLSDEKYNVLPAFVSKKEYVQFEIIVNFPQTSGIHRIKFMDGQEIIANIQRTDDANICHISREIKKENIVYMNTKLSDQYAGYVIE